MTTEPSKPKEVNEIGPMCKRPKNNLHNNLMDYNKGIFFGRRFVLN